MGLNGFKWSSIGCYLTQTRYLTNRSHIKSKLLKRDVSRGNTEEDKKEHLSLSITIEGGDCQRPNSIKSAVTLA